MISPHHKDEAFLFVILACLIIFFKSFSCVATKNKTNQNKNIYKARRRL